jgi:hypothetical protein
LPATFWFICLFCTVKVEYCDGISGEMEETHKSTAKRNINYSLLGMRGNHISNLLSNPNTQKNMQKNIGGVGLGSASANS